MTIDMWEKPRSHGDRFNNKEREFIRKCYRAGDPARKVAEILKCATRTINVHYALIRAGGRSEPNEGDHEPRHLSLKERPIPKWKPPKMAPGLTLERLTGRRA